MTNHAVLNIVVDKILLIAIMTNFIR